MVLRITSSCVVERRFFLDPRDLCDLVSKLIIYMLNINH